MNGSATTNRAVRLLAAVVVSLAAVPWTALADQVRVSCRHQEIFSPEGNGPATLYLAHRPMVRSSETVLAGGEPLARDSDYTVDYAQGIVYLAPAAGGGADRQISVTYSVLPFGLKTSYRLREVTDGQPAASPAAPPVSNPPVRLPSASSGLRASGSKTVSVEAGSLGNFKVSQALNLSLAGKIGEGVEVRGVLSDKDMSFSDRTATATLRDMDRVFLEVRSPSAYARVGDLQIEEAPGELLSFTRDLTGFLGNASHGSDRVVVSGAESRTSHQTVETAAREGISGPYSLTDRAGEIPSIVVNSDRVWLDGEAMKRGKNEDYTIDYQRAEIYFNPRRTMLEGARIVVDFQSERPDGRRQFYYARSSVGLGSRVGLTASFLNEGVAPAGLESAAGLGEGQTESDVRWTDGATFVGLGGGDYVRISVDSLAYYEYAGEGAGEYDVAFTWVGEGRGTYSYLFSDRWNREVHVFTGQGGYVDKVQSQSRLKAQVLHLGAEAKTGGWLEVATEFAQSRGHKETGEGLYRMAEDRAYVARLSGKGDLPQVAGRSIGRLDYGAKRRWVGDGYLAVARLRSPGVLQAWGQDPGGGFEATNELSLGYSLGEKLKTSFEFGTMGTALGDSRRRKTALDLGSARLGLFASSEVASLTGDSAARGVERTAIGLRFPVKLADLVFGRKTDLRNRLSGDLAQMVTQYYGEARVAAGGNRVALSLSRSEERRGGTDADLQAYSSSTDGTLDFETDQARRLALRGQVAHRRATYSPEAGPAATTLTSADLALTARGLWVLSTLALDYGLANTLTSTYTPELVKVGPGGDYDSAGHYVPGDGTYELARRESGKQPVTRMKAALTADTGIKGKILQDKALSSRTALEIEGESSRGNVGRLALPDPSYVLDGAEVVYGRAAINEEVVLSRARGVTLSLSGRASSSLDARCLDRVERNSDAQVSARAASASIGNTSLSVEGRMASRTRSVESDGSRITPGSSAWALGANLERTVTAWFRGRLGAELASDRLSQPNSAYRQGTASGGCTAFVGALRCDAGLVVKRLVGSDNASAREVNLRNSVDWTSRLNLRRGRHTSFSLEYLGRKTRAARAIHNLRASLSATF
ncbi:MAG: hypothetical protein WAW06_04685 [bacterium]